MIPILYDCSVVVKLSLLMELCTINIVVHINFQMLLLFPQQMKNQPSHH